MFDPESLIETIAVGLFTGGAAWGAMRGELKWVHERLKDAHLRIDRVENEGSDTRVRVATVEGRLHIIHHERDR